MIKGIAVTCYPTKDMARARAFYETILGLPQGETFGNHWQEYDVGNGTFGIGMAPEDAPEYFKNRGTSIMFEVEDLDAALEKMKAHQVPIVFEPMAFPNCRMFAITDPDDNVIYLHQLNPKV